MKSAQMPQDQQQIDEFYMRMALALARQAAAVGEVPVGALVVAEDNTILSKSFNKREGLQTPLGHAEVIALHRAAKSRQSWRLSDCTLYVTLEPCLMCSGTALQSRVKRVVYGARDPKAGAAETLYQVLTDSRLNHQCQLTGGVLADESSKILTDFFRQLRLSKRKDL